MSAWSRFGYALLAAGLIAGTSAWDGSHSPHPETNSSSSDVVVATVGLERILAGQLATDVAGTVSDPTDRDGFEQQGWLKATASG
jgi:hypothetical protein